MLTLVPAFCGEEIEVFMAFVRRRSVRAGLVGRQRRSIANPPANPLPFPPAAATKRLFQKIKECTHTLPAWSEHRGHSTNSFYTQAGIFVNMDFGDSPLANVEIVTPCLFSAFQCLLFRRAAQLQILDAGEQICAEENLLHPGEEFTFELYLCCVDYTSALGYGFQPGQAEPDCPAANSFDQNYYIVSDKPERAFQALCNFAAVKNSSPILGAGGFDTTQVGRLIFSYAPRAHHIGGQPDYRSNNHPDVQTGSYQKRRAMLTIKDPFSARGQRAHMTVSEIVSSNRGALASIALNQAVARIASVTDKPFGLEFEHNALETLKRAAVGEPLRLRNGSKISSAEALTVYLNGISHHLSSQFFTDENVREIRAAVTEVRHWLKTPETDLQFLDGPFKRGLYEELLGEYHLDHSDLARLSEITAELIGVFRNYIPVCKNLALLPDLAATGPDSLQEKVKWFLANAGCSFNQLQTFWELRAQAFTLDLESTRVGGLFDTLANAGSGDIRFPLHWLEEALSDGPQELCRSRSMARFVQKYSTQSSDGYGLNWCELRYPAGRQYKIEMLPEPSDYCTDL